MDNLSFNSRCLGFSFETAGKYWLFCYKVFATGFVFERYCEDWNFGFMYVGIFTFAWICEEFFQIQRSQELKVLMHCLYWGLNKDENSRYLRYI